MRIREHTEDLGWFVLILLLLPLAIPVGAMVFMFLLGQRLLAWSQGRRRAGFAG